MTKDEYLKVCDELYTGNSKEIMESQIEKFFKYKGSYKKPKHNYKIGDDVLLKKGTLMHGALKNIEALEHISKEGLLSALTVNELVGKHPACAALWNLKWDISLKDYINFYSGGTMLFNNLGNDKRETLVLPYDKLGDLTKTIHSKDYQRWNLEQTKEARFLPSLVQNKVQIGIIFDSQNDAIKDLLKGDILDSKNINDEDVKPFVSENYYNYFISYRLNKDDFFTDRESAVLFGIPENFIEGIMVGRKYEKDSDMLKKIKDILPNVYICNLDGKVIKE